ncbi:cysteine-rich venom protein LIO1-like [Centruroides sculpturatus]|uniref:cysteine-rich venom protein LIO1-like n=1 Tax=Centruroides sculpturatus TaxID=218467 RepID=UPI000C6D57E4|nr:cysteine-rich venom protein LIO1-like [Centruroides sculpturatus]
MTLSLGWLEILYILSYILIISAKNITWINFERRSRSHDQYESRLTGMEKKLYVDLHNMYRRKVSIPASNMKYMEWNEDLAAIAQDWANQCIWDHGNLEHSKFDRMGQNLYKGYTRDPHQAMKLWFDEYVFYNFHDASCKPNEQCGHYTQVVWANSRLVGCALKLNCWHNYRFYIACNYYPPKSCGLCVTRNQCKQYDLNCECNLNCYNCGTLNKEKCKCECKRGWDGIDCSIPCADENQNCRPWVCNSPNFNKNQYNPCRKSCGLCEVVNKSNLLDTCCDGQMCPKGYVLNQYRPCSCDILCPGPMCNTATTNPSKENLIVTLIVISILIKHLM